MTDSTEIIQTITIESEGPDHLGAAVFNQVCMPVIRECAQQMNTEALMAFYKGFVESCLGCMAADFGKETAIAMAEHMVESLKTFEPEGATLQ